MGKWLSVGTRGYRRRQGTMQRRTQPLSARLSWDEVHRLEVLMRTRAFGLAQRSAHPASCAACGRPLGDEGIRLAGVRMHPGCLPGS
jgi:hypothetical protein